MANLLLIKQGLFLDNHKDIKDKIESHLWQDNLVVTNYG